MEITQYQEGDSGEGQRQGRQDARPPGDSASRHVIRDKGPLHTPSLGTKGPTSFDPVDTERREVSSWGRRGYGIIFHPQPHLCGVPEVAHVDWLSVTFRPPPEFGWKDIFHAVQRAAPIRVTERKETGWNVYEFCALLGDFGFIAWDGEHQRRTVHVENICTGCMLGESWRPLIALCEIFEGRITRVDLAHEDFFREVCNIEQLLA